MKTQGFLGIPAVLGCAAIMAGAAVDGHGALLYQWNLNEGTGATVSPQVGAISGTIHGNVPWQSGGPPATNVLGGGTVSTTYSLSFGGTTADYIDFGTDASLAPGYITVAIWAKKGETATPAFTKFLARYGSIPGSYEIGFVDGRLEWRFFTATGNDVRIGYQGTGYTPYLNTQFDDGNWHLLVGTYDGTTGSLYVDGNLITSLTTTASTINQPAGQTLSLGKRPYPGAEEPFPGLLGGPLLIYNEALTGAQVASLMATVPEPSAIMLLSLGMVGMLATGRPKLL